MSSFLRWRELSRGICRRRVALSRDTSFMAENSRGRTSPAAASGNGHRRVVGHAGQVGQAVAVHGEGQYLHRGAVGIVLCSGAGSIRARPGSCLLYGPDGRLKGGGGVFRVRCHKQVRAEKELRMHRVTVHRNS